MDATMKGKWNQVQGRIKKAWGELTDDDIARTDGDLDKLVGVIQEKYGQAAQSAKQQLAEIIQGLQGEDADDTPSGRAPVGGTRASTPTPPTRPS